jgi:DNA mismatch repair protein MutS2
MKAYAQSTPGVACASFGYDPHSYQPTYRLALGAPGRSLAFEMAERLGVPAAVVADARSRRDQKEEQAEALLAKLEQERAALTLEAKRLAEDRRSIDEAAARLQGQEREIQARKRMELEAFARELRTRGEEAARKAADAIHQAVTRVEAARKSVAAAGTTARTQALRQIRQAQKEVLEDPSLGLAAQEAAAPADVAAGSRVRIRDLGLVGEVLERSGEEVEVAVSGKRLRVPLEAVRVVSGPASAAAVIKPPAAPAVKRSGEVPSEINLVGLTVDEALPRVDKLLDDAALCERRQVRVIHGFGQGRLRKAVAGLLEGHPHVAAFRAGGEREGGGGVTIVELKE